MKTINTKYSKALMLLMLFTVSGILSSAFAQVKVPFTQRTSYLTPNQKIYNIKGDFQMIGNTNLKRFDNLNGDNVNNGNTNMSYVDIDGIASTLNSSSATLTLPTGVEEADPTCSNIIYAGLYWLGRAHNTNSPNQFSTDGETDEMHNNGSFNGYTLKITSADQYQGNGTDNGRIATYTFTPTGGGDAVTFRLKTWSTREFIWNEYTGKVTVQVGTGAETDVPSTIDNNSLTNFGFSFSPVAVTTGTETIYVNRLRRARTSNNINSYFKARVSTGGHVFDKGMVKLKHKNEAAYTIVSAQHISYSSNIYFPRNSEDYMYSAYAEVTDYVRKYGIGEYTVADIALNQGDGGAAGFFGGWGMVVVYENSKMKWRDVTIFDGYAFVEGATRNYELPVSGFRTAQHGAIDLKLGLIAGEGDRDIKGDYFQIRNQADNAWVNLKHNGNATDNFFNSSIPGSNNRNPKLVNNFGIDIAEFTINNNNNSIITNNQTSTKFRYGSTQDTYIIPVIAMAVDAYVPDVQALINVESIHDNNGNPTKILLPNGDVEYKLELKNPGNEKILNAAINIPIPYTAQYISASAKYFHGTGSPSPQQPKLIESNGSKSIQWNIGDIPMGGTENPVLAELTFKVKATNDCFLLVNDKCTPTVLIEGTVSGKGETSGTEFSTLRFIRGYKDGACEGEPIYGPLSIDIDAAEFVHNNCPTGEEVQAIKEFFFCQNPNTSTINFHQIANYFPTGSRFWSAVTTEDLDGIIVVRPAKDATEYIATSTFPNTLGENTYYALPPSTSTCWWEFKIKVERCNLWLGSESEDWGTAANWTLNEIPDGPDKNVTFATKLNHGEEAQRDLVLDKDRTIGNITNLTDSRKLIIPAEKTLIIDKVADTGTAEKLVLKSEVGKANAALIFNAPNSNETVQATVEFASKSKKSEDTWPRVWQFFGIPVQDKTLTNLFGTNVHGNIYGYNPDTDIVVRKYNEALLIPGNVQEKWENLDANTEMLPYLGYEITQPTEGMVHSLSGTLLTEAKKTLSFKISPSGVYARGNYMLANPYTAPISISKMQASDFVNLANSVYIYNTGSRQDWITNNGHSQLGNLPGTYTSIPIKVARTMNMTQIPSMQAFMVKAIEEDAPTTSFTFKYENVQRTSSETPTNEPMRARRVAGEESTENGMNQEIKPLIKMDVIGESSSDRVYLITAEGTGKAYDNGWDGYKTLAGGMAQLFAIDANNKKMQVNTDADLNETYIGFRSGGENSYTIKFSFNEQMNGVYESLFIQDLATGHTAEITDGATFYFESNPRGATEKRFKLSASKIKTSWNATESESPIRLSANSSSIFVNNTTDQELIITVYNNVGQTVMITKAATGINNLDHSLVKGTYIIDARTINNTEKSILKAIFK